jgi:flagellar assembly protein FliH
MKKMDLYKANVIKANEIIDSGKPVSLSCVYDIDNDPNANLSEEAAIPQTEEEKLHKEKEERQKKITDESYSKGFKEGVELQKQETLTVMEAIAAMTKRIPEIRKEVIEKSEEQIVKLSVAIAEKILNQEITTRKEIILGVLKGALKNVSETEGMKIRLNPLDFRYMMEVKKDFLQSFDGVRNIIFEEDTSIRKGGAVIETMFGEVDARLENQLKEIKSSLLNH